MTVRANRATLSALVQQARWAEADALAQQGLATEPDNPELLHLQGVAKIGLKDYETGLHLIERAANLDPTSTIYHLQLGAVGQWLGVWSLAEAGYRRALVLAPQDVTALHGLLRVLVECGRGNEVEPLYRRLLALNQEDDTVRALMATARLAQGRLEEAAASFAAITDPSHSTVLRTFGDIRRWQGRPAEAVDLYAKAIEYHPDDNLARYGLGAAFQALGQRAAALAAFGPAVDHMVWAACRACDIDVEALRTLRLTAEDAAGFAERGRQRGSEAGGAAEGLAWLALALAIIRHRGWQRNFDTLLAQLGKKRVLFEFLSYVTVGSLALEPAGLLNFRQIGEGPDADTYHILVSGERPANQTLLDVIKCHFPVVQSDILYHALSDRLPASWRGNWLARTYENAPRFRAAGVRQTLALAPEMVTVGRAYLSHCGLEPEHDWFVCVFARDGGYVRTFKDGLETTYTDFRNADIDSYGAAIEAIVAAGGWVFRLGAAATKPLSFPHERVIDYACRDRTDLLDIFLASHCRFMMGTPAGITDVAGTFGRPFLAVHSTPPCWCTPTGSLYITKLLCRCRPDGLPPRPEDELTPEDYRRLSLLPNGRMRVFTDAGLATEALCYRDNTAEELREAALEMLERLDGHFTLGPEDAELHRRYHAAWATVAMVQDGHRPPIPMVNSFLRRYQHRLIPAQDWN